MENEKQEFSAEITEHVATLYTNPKSGWTKELNKVSFNGGFAKLDIRDWSPDHSKMGKGVTLTKNDAIALRDALNTLNL